MNKKNFNELSKSELEKVMGGKIQGATVGVITGWNYQNGIYYVDIAYEGSEPSCHVPWGTTMPQIGSLAG